MTTSRMRTAKAGTSNHFIDNVRDALLRGGRLTKWKGKVASIAPMMGADLANTIVEAVSAALPSRLTGLARLSGGASAAALGAVMMIGGVGQAVAGTCAPTTPGNWLCSGLIGMDMPQSIYGPADVPIVVTTTAEFGLDVGVTGNNGLRSAIYIVGSGDSDIVFTDNNNAFIRGPFNGIDGKIYGTGSLSITTTGVTEGVNNAGITGYVGRYGNNLTITAADSIGKTGGIGARNLGSGALSITATGALTGTTGGGLLTESHGADVNISTVDTTGFVNGIQAFHLGFGALNINSAGTAASVGGGGAGILASSEGKEFNLISHNAIGFNGMVITNLDGPLSITTTGTTIGSGLYGIRAISIYDGTNYRPTSMSITTGGSVFGYFFGIDALNYGTGGLTITANADVTGELGTGIRAHNSANDTTASMLITQAVGTTTTGFGYGISADNAGGSLTINALGAAIGTTNIGIAAVNQSTSTALTISSFEAKGGIYGIRALNYGKGATAITTNGTTTGKLDAGLRARNFDAGNMSITIAEGSSVEGFLDGIRADSQRVGSDQTGDMIIDVLGSVSSGRDGIRVGQQGDGDFTVTISGSVYGRENGLHNSYVEFYEYDPTYTRGGTFIITETGVLTGGLNGSGVAFRDSARDLEITVNAPSSHLNVFGTLNGDAVMGEGSDRITISGPAASLGSPVTFNGDGDGITPYNEYAYNNGSYRFKEPDFTTNQTDRLTFSNWSGSDEAGRSDVTITDIDGSQIVNMEEVFLTEGADVTFADAISPGWGMSNLSVNDLLFEVQDGSIARFVDDFTVFGNVNNFGALDLSAPNLTVGTALTITGNYAAASDLFLDVFLNDGGPDNVAANDAFFTDQVFIGGNVSGVTHVFVNNLGGAGAITDLNGNGLVDANEGILIVQVAGATPLDTMTDSVALAEHFVLGSAANTFVSPLTSRTNVSVGAFAYDIYAIGADATGNVNGTMDYVLAALNFSPVSPVYEAYPSFLLDQIGLPRLQERVGNRHWARPAAEPQVAAAETVYVFCKDPAQNFRCAVTPEQAQVYADPIFGSVGTDTATVIEGQGLWLRADGALSRYTPVASTIGAGYKAHSAGIQVGYDHVLMETETGGRLIGGVNVSYRTSGADVTSDVGLGEIATAGYGLGASLTWYAENGFYIDAQAQAVWLDSDLSADGLGRFAAGHKTEGYGMSVEMGKEIALSDTWAITPQAQVSYANVQENGVTDSLGSMVSFKAESLKLRVGVELSNEKTWEAEDGTTSRRSLRAGAHVIHEFKPETKVMVAGTPLLSKRDATTAEITLGGTYNWSDDRNSVYAQIGASTGLGNFGDSHRVRGTVGFRRQWE